MTAVADAAAALAAVGLRPGQRVADLSGAQAAAFRRLVGWEPDPPVVAGPTPGEAAARAARQAWKAVRRERRVSRSEPRLLWHPEAVARVRRAWLDGTAPDWLPRLLDTARRVADLGPRRLCALVPWRAPWNAAGSFCPACLGQRSDVSPHAPFWRWHVDRPEHIACPHCGTEFPDPRFPETGRLDLPRLGWSWTYYLSPRERHGDPRDGTHASRFGGGPTHVSFTGEAARCALNWVLGQLQPMALAAAVTGEAALGDAVRAVFGRLAEVYPGYPLVTYRQEYYDCDPAWAVADCDELPAVFRRGACLYTFCGRLGQVDGLHGRGDSTIDACRYPNAEWGCSRMAREKASHGQLFLSLMHAWDLVAAGAPETLRRRVEGDLLLEYYLDVKGLTRRIDNKSGPGTAARVAAGLLWDDEGEIADGVDRFHRLLATQFHDDGSWKETPIYGAKSLLEGLWEVPELLRQRDLYARTPLLRRAFEVYAGAATPCGTQPTLDDSPVDFSLPAHLRDLARRRVGVAVPAAPATLAAFGPAAGGAARPGHRGFGGYVPRLDMVPDDDDRLPGDGGLGFGAVGHLPRPAADRSWIGLALDAADVAAAEPADRPALNRFFRGRGLACFGFGSGPGSTQLYVDGGDGRRGHRHAAPLALAGFHAGREVLPDLGYIADHPANAWIRATAAHNTVVVDGRSLEAAARVELAAFAVDGAARFVDLRLPVRHVGGDAVVARFRRALLAWQAADGVVLLVDLFEATAAHPATFDWVCRAGGPDGAAVAEGATWVARPDGWLAGDEPPGPTGARSAGPARNLAVSWSGAGGPAVGARLVHASDEVVAFESPAWRTQAEVFAAPGSAWTAVACRQRGRAARFVTVFALGGAPPTAVLDDRVATLRRNTVSLRIDASGLAWRAGVGDASFHLQPIPESMA